MRGNVDLRCVVQRLGFRFPIRLDRFGFNCCCCCQYIFSPVPDGTYLKLSFIPRKQVQSLVSQKDP
jgi:hypothetical protein